MLRQKKYSTLLQSSLRVLVIVFLISFSKSWGQTTDLIFSEYLEGSSNNKYIEIYNGTGSAVNLADYKLRLYANGASSPANDVALSGSLATCSVVIYKNTLAALTLPGGVTSTANAAVNYNGDDALVLFKISTNSIVDIIGQIGCDPGTAWTSGANTTIDKTLVRKGGVCSGITTNPSTACGVGSFPTLSSEWDVYNINDASNLGSHANICGGCGITYTVTFNTNGGTGGSMSNQTASSTTALTSNGFTKTGCTFSSWNTAADGSGTSFANGASYSFAADLTLYAQWNCNAITTGSLSNTPFALTDCTITATGNVDFTSSGTFVAGNVYTAQLSNAAGSFASAVNVGTISSTSNSGTIPIIVPAATPSGSGYLIRVISSNPSVTGSNSAAFTITLTCVVATNCPVITAVVIDSCPGTPTVCSEGLSEAIFVTNGSSTINATSSANASANFTVRYGSNPTYSSNNTLTDGFVNNIAAITCLNSSVGCGGIFINALGTTIPAFAKIMLVRSDFCCPTSSGQTDFQNLCSAGVPIYVLFSNDINILSNGTYKNGPFSTCPDEFRYFSLSTAGSGCSAFNAYYDACLLTNQADGDYVAFTSSAGAASYGNSGCTIPFALLPIELIDFYATKNNDVNDVFWKVGSEENVLYYTIDKSNNGIDFKELTTVFVSSNSQSKTYNVVDQEPFSDITYYRLGTKEKNGKDYFYKIISVNEKSDDWKCNHYQQEQNLVIEFKNSVPKHSSISLFDLSGKLLAEEEVNNSQTKINVQNFAEGIYFVRITTPYKTENFKIIIIK
jgi:hypothetical protein